MFTILVGANKLVEGPFTHDPAPKSGQTRVVISAAEFREFEKITAIRHIYENGAIRAATDAELPAAEVTSKQQRAVLSAAVERLQSGAATTADRDALLKYIVKRLLFIPALFFLGCASPVEHISKGEIDPAEWKTVHIAIAINDVESARRELARSEKVLSELQEK